MAHTQAISSVSNGLNPEIKMLAAVKRQKDANHKQQQKKNKKNEAINNVWNHSSIKCEYRSNSHFIHDRNEQYYSLIECRATASNIIIDNGYILASDIITAQLQLTTARPTIQRNRFIALRFYLTDFLRAIRLS